MNVKGRLAKLEERVKPATQFLVLYAGSDDRDDDALQEAEMIKRFGGGPRPADVRCFVVRFVAPQTGHPVRTEERQLKEQRA